MGAPPETKSWLRPWHQLQKDRAISFGRVFSWPYSSSSREPEGSGRAERLAGRGGQKYSTTFPLPSHPPISTSLGPSSRHQVTCDAGGVEGIGLSLYPKIPPDVKQGFLLSLGNFFSEKAHQSKETSASETSASMHARQYDAPSKLEDRPSAT